MLCHLQHDFQASRVVFTGRVIIGNGAEEEQAASKQASAAEASPKTKSSSPEEVQVPDMNTAYIARVKTALENVKSHAVFADIEKVRRS